jgi:hypothetical protein
MKTPRQRDDLVRLPNGMWVSPRVVTAIVPCKAQDNALGAHPSRVIVYFNAGSAESISANSDENAIELAGQIAALLRGASR